MLASNNHLVRQVSLGPIDLLLLFDVVDDDDDDTVVRT